MSNNRQIKSRGATAYRSPRVIEQPLDSGGNYISPAGMKQGLSGVEGDLSNVGTLGTSIIE